MKTTRSILRVLAAALATLLLSALASHAQLPEPPATTEDALHQMFDQAGIIFTGRVTAVRRIDSNNGSTGILEIDFGVDDAILGVAPDTIYTLREWAGLAPAGTSALLIGRRYLMFLHAPSPAGLSSPVGGPDGAIPILPTAEAASPTTPDTAGLAVQAALAQAASTALHSPARTTFRLAAAADPAANSAALANLSVDLRWIAARILAPVAYAPAPTTPAGAHPVMLRANLSIDGASPATAASVEPAASHPATAGYADVLAMLRFWQKERRAIP